MPDPQLGFHSAFQSSDAFWLRAAELGLHDRVSFVERPTRAELVRLYQKASIFALTSDEEGLGVVLLEAMACALPVVSTRSGGPDGIIADGEDGYLVPIDDVTTLSSRLEDLLQAPGIQADNTARRSR